jgi:hypothetical protein
VQGDEPGRIEAMSKKPEPAQDQPGGKYFGWGEPRYRSEAELSQSELDDIDAQFQRIFGYPPPKRGKPRSLASRPHQPGPPRQAANISMILEIPLTHPGQGT